MQQNPLTGVLYDLLAASDIANPMESALRIAEAACHDDHERWRARALELAQAHISGAPLGYLVGRQRFMNVELMVAPGSLAPRAETELLGDTAVELLRPLCAERNNGVDRVRVIDMCCGVGNLACGIAEVLHAARIWASDLSAASVALAKRNVETLGFGKRIEVVQGDLFTPLSGRGLEGTIDAIVCNPPYIPSTQLERAASKLLRHEPREAFDGGPYGVSMYQRVTKSALLFLRAGGCLLFEIGHGQDSLVKFIVNRTGGYAAVEFINNADGAPRVAVARKKQRNV